MDAKATSTPEAPSTTEDHNTPPVVLSKARLILLASAPAVLWFAGVMHVCGIGFLLPVIQADLDSSYGLVQWVNSSFNITWGCFALVAGRLSDIYGLRKAYIVGLSWYCLWLFISAFMPNVMALSITRGLAGIGFAIASPCGSGLIATHFPPGRGKTIAFAVMAGAGAIGAGLGWLLGGFFAEITRFTWRALTILVAVPIIYPILVGVFIVPADTPHPHDRRVDWIGAIAITVAQLMLTLALTFAVTKSWKAPYVPPLIVVAAMVFVFFIWRQRKLGKEAPGSVRPPPLTPARLFVGSKGQLVPLYISAVFVWISVDTLAVFGAYFYDEVLLLKGWQSGLRVGPNAFGGLVASIIVGLSLSRIPARALLIVVDTIGGVAGIFFAARQITTAYWKSDLWAWLATGWASDGTLAVGSIMISNVTKPGDQAVANAILISCSRFGVSLGLAIATIIRDEVQQHKEASIRVDRAADPDSSLSWPDEQMARWKGIQAGFYLTAAASLIAAAVIAVTMRGWQVVGKKGGQDPEESTAVPRTGAEGAQAIIPISSADVTKRPVPNV